MNERQSNRDAAPMIAELMDQFEKVFGKGAYKLVYCKEGDFERGTPFEPVKDSENDH